MTISLTTIPRCGGCSTDKFLPLHSQNVALAGNRRHFQESVDQSIRLYRSRVMVSSTIVDPYVFPVTNFSFFLTRMVNRSYSTEVILLKWHPGAFKLINMWYNQGIQIICCLEGLALSDAVLTVLSVSLSERIYQHKLLGPSTSQARILDVVINWAESTRQACSQNPVDNSILRCGILPYGIERWTEQTSVLGGAGDHHLESFSPDLLKPGRYGVNFGTYHRDRNPSVSLSEAVGEKELLILQTNPAILSFNLDSLPPPLSSIVTIRLYPRDEDQLRAPRSGMDATFVTQRLSCMSETSHESQLYFFLKLLPGS
ncbi:uncharacterized protein ARMOST_20987 [Armillaria ostoyae]|uniref:Uncharacterized protein n=1 Tax=Armillaria ostoyae TaxID=47428 RepID=A0A284S8U7_ARMOS|nr:uncharacterized protein ARMOST_20987 [Armillaria ostoyae]